MSRKRKRGPRGCDIDVAAEFERRFCYTFSDPGLLVAAVTHTSYAEEEDGAIQDNQRLEFLGDAVVGLVVTEALYAAHPSADEGVMSKMKGRLVSTRSLAAASAEHGLGEWLRLGRGEERSRGRDKRRLLADVFEAIAGALLLDGGLPAARNWVLSMFDERLAEATPSSVGVDHKSVLQEHVQGQAGARPEYRTVEVAGPGHEQVFTVEVQVDGRQVGLGRGRSKKEAQQDAARVALQALTQPSSATK